MTPEAAAIERLKFRRFRTLRTSKPICATCGERRWWVRYEDHHVAGRRFSDLTIRLCLNCHNGISVMQTLLPPAGDGPRGQLIAQLQGLALLFELALANIQQLLELLNGLPSLFQPDNGEGGR